MLIQPGELTFGAFVQCSQSAAIVGLRDASTGNIIASIEIPAHVIEGAILENVSVDLALMGDGVIASAVAGPASDFLSLRASMTIDRLVEAYVNSENLHKEEVTVAELRALLGRLHKSVEAVERAIDLFKVKGK